MRAILIDPKKKTVTEIQLKSDDYREIRTVLQCHSYTTGAHLGGSIAKGFDAVFVSDNLSRSEGIRGFGFKLMPAASRHLPSRLPAAGWR